MNYMERDYSIWGDLKKIVNKINIIYKFMSKSI